MLLYVCELISLGMGIANSQLLLFAEVQYLLCVKFLREEFVDVNYVRSIHEDVPIGRKN